MADIITNIGEEWYAEIAIDGVTLTFGLHDNTDDQLTESSTLSDITEPGGSDYARQTDTITTASFSGDFGFDNDNKIEFQTGGGSTLQADSCFVVYNFQSDDVAGDGSAQDHLLMSGLLDQSYDLSTRTSVSIPAGDYRVTNS